MADYEQDSLVINISANTGDAKSSIDSIIESLNKLNKAINNLTVDNKLNSVKNTLSKIAKIDFTNVAKGLANVADAFRALNKMSNGTKLPFTFETPQAEQPIGAAQSDINPAEWEKAKIAVEDVKVETEQLADSIKAASTESEKLAFILSTGFGISSDITEPAVKLKDALFEAERPFDDMKDKADQLNISFDNVASTIGKSTTTIWDFEEGVDNARIRTGGLLNILGNVFPSLGKISDEIDECGGLMGTFTKAWKMSNVYGAGLVTKLAGLMRSIKRIAFYRLIRAVIQLIAKAIKESINNLYAFSDSIGGTFAKTMDKLKSSFEYFINSFATIIQPIIEILQPILSFILDATAALNNVIGAFLQALTGAKGITQATKEVKKFNDEASKTKSLGLDELNVLNDTSAGGFSIFGDIDEESTAYNLINGVFETISKIFDMVQKIVITVAPLISSIIQTLQPINDLILSVVGNLVELVSKVLTPITELLGKIIEPLQKIFQIVGELINAHLAPLIELLNQIFEIVFSIIDPILEFVMETLQPLFDYINENLDWLIDLIKLFTDTVVNVIKLIVEPIKAIVKTLVAIFTLNFGEIGNIWSDMCNNMGKIWEKVWKGIGNFFIGIINGVITGFEGFINLFVKAINGITKGISSLWTWLGIPPIPEIPLVKLGRIPALSTGGLVEDGLFMANHGELIGGFAGGKTAVANNEQITTGIYEAVRDALQDAGFGSEGEKTTEVNVYLDSKKIAKQVKTVEKEGGVAIYKGATNYAG